MTDLKDQKCMPCQGGTPPLTPAEIEPLISTLNANWNVIEHHHLSKTFTFPDFKSALMFVNNVGDIAETENHHPNISFTWGSVTITIWTHKIDGLAKSDFILAAKINNIYE